MDPEPCPFVIIKDDGVPRAGTIPIMRVIVRPVDDKEHRPSTTH